MIIKLDRIPRPGETILGGEFVTAAGGKGRQPGGRRRPGRRRRHASSPAWARTCSATRPWPASCKDGINVDYVVRDKASPSGVALIFVAKDGENSIAVASGANGRLSPADVKKGAKAIASAAVVVMQLETPLATVQAAAEHRGESRRASDSQSRARPAVARRAAAAGFILTPNETEAELLTGIKVDDEASAGQAADQLLGSRRANGDHHPGPRGRFRGDRRAAEARPRASR